MPFGKHKGIELSEVPADYRDWLLKQEWIDKFEDLKQELLDLKDTGKPAEPKKKEKTAPAPQEVDDDNPF